MKLLLVASLITFGVLLQCQPSTSIIEITPVSPTAYYCTADVVYIIDEGSMSSTDVYYARKALRELSNIPWYFPIHPFRVNVGFSTDSFVTRLYQGRWYPHVNDRVNSMGYSRPTLSAYSLLYKALFDIFRKPGNRRASNYVVIITRGLNRSARWMVSYMKRYGVKDVLAYHPRYSKIASHAAKRICSRSRVESSPRAAAAEKAPVLVGAAPPSDETKLAIAKAKVAAVPVVA